MSATGGSFMQQPNNNSEAVKRCMILPNAPLSSQLRFTPHPPYAAGPSPSKRVRPSSAPVRKEVKSYSVPWHGPKFVEPKNPSRYYNVSLLNHRASSSDTSRHAPYAERQIESFVNSTLGYPKIENSHSISVTAYDPLSDPHLVEYFERRFGTIQLESLRKQQLQGRWMRRGSSSRSSSTISWIGKPRSSRRIKKDGDVLYKIAVTTGNIRNSGTDAKIFITMKGLKGKIQKTRLTKKAGSVKSGKKVAFKFTKGSTHVFKVYGNNIGDIKSIILECDAVKKEEAWFCQEVEIVNTKTKKSYHFLCNQWFSWHHGDGQKTRELFAIKASKTEYEVVTVTGEQPGGGTNANVFMTLYGKTGVTEKIQLKNNRNPFQKGASDVFRFKSKCVGPMKKLRIEHDNIGFAPGWYLERVVVSDLVNPQWKYFFPCGQWLAKDEADGEICRDLLGSQDPLAMRTASKYKVTVYTGDKPKAGTDAKVTLIMFGEFGDSGDKRLTKNKRNCFERKSIDEFILQCPKLGRLERVRIQHDNSGIGPGWFLEKIIVDDVEMSAVYEFPCHRWLAINEDDGKISRELLLNIGPNDMSLGYPFVITVSTGDATNAGTDARVFIILYGGNQGNETSGKIWLDTGKFERNTMDIFNVDVAKMISPLSKLDIGHDNTGIAAGWLLKSVTVFCPASGIEQFFPCDKWLASDEEDTTIQRTLYEQKALRKKKEKMINWQAWVFTSDIKGGGTDANVFICIYGDKGHSDDVLLENKGDSFEKGNMDTFRFNTSEVGVPYKVRVWHDNSGLAAGWHLDKIELESMEGRKRYTFKCNRWLATDEDDKEIVREIPAEGGNIKKRLPVVTYVVQVYTGKETGAGTDANVYITIFGQLGDTGKRFLKYSKNNKNKFEKGKMDEFEIEAVTLHKLKKIRIGHDGKGIGDGWFLDKVVVRPKDRTDAAAEVTFTCGRWLAKDEDDGLIEREISASGSQMLNLTTFNVSVKTGDVRSAGTDANVYLKLFGEKGDTGSLHLRQSENAWNKFETGRTDLFKLELSDIGKLKRIKIGHDGTKMGSDWFLDSVKIDIPSKGEQYLFAVHRWLSGSQGDKKTEIEIEPSVTQDIEKTIPYEITIWTSDILHAGTDSNVFLQMYGKDGKTQEIQLRNKTNNFERAQMDKFKIQAADVGRLIKVRIGHDGTGMFSGWHLEKMQIQRKISDKRKSKKQIMSEREKRKSLIALHMDDSDPGSPPSARRRRSYRPNRQMSVVIEEEDEDETEDYWFFINSWFARGEGDKTIVKEFLPTDENGKPLKGSPQEVEYTVYVHTGDERFAGTDANVFITLYGELGDSGERQLSDSSTNFNKFERKQEDIFTVKAIDLGKLTKLNIRHDNAGGGADWFLDRVEVQDMKTKRNYFFPCQRWLATGKDDGQLSRELVPVAQELMEKLLKGGSSKNFRDQLILETKAAMTTYHVKVYTGDVFGAGTDANVYIILFGQNETSNKMFLKSSSTNKNKFERKQMDEFLLELVDIGELKKIKIGHDNKGGGGAWFLDKVEIDAPSLGRYWVFPCGHWLSETDEDRLLERELFPQELATEEYTPCIPYEITTYTSDIRGAGTDSMVYVVLYGKQTATQQKNLCSSKRDAKDKFKRGQMDKFVVELEDVGATIEKLRIGHDASGWGSSWHLDKVEVRRLHSSGKLGSITYVFPCGRWLAKDEDDRAIERELLPQKAVQEVVSKTGETKVKDLELLRRLQNKKYTVEVFTGNLKQCGTDANVFLTIFGDQGDSGERQLRNSETHSDKFERNKMDRFTLEAVDLGKLFKIKIRHDNSMFNPAWFLDKVEITDGKDKYVFHCERWLAKNKDDGKLERSLYVKGYDGETSSTGTLKSTRFGGSVASLESADPFSRSPRLPRRSIHSSLEDVPEGPTIPYTVKVSTGEGEDNGTTSNVWIKIYGSKSLHSGRIFLELMQKKMFEPSSVETFSIEALDVKEVKKVEIGHDGVAPGSGWFLKDLEVDLPTKGKHYHFKCNYWLARDKGDGKTSRILTVDDGVSSITSYKPMVSYDVTVTTGDVQDAGTDCKISLTAFGLKGTSSIIQLDKNGDRFERARTDIIRMEIEDIAPLKKIRLTLDEKGSRKNWYLEKVELLNLETGVLSVFKYKGWIGKNKEDAKNPVDIPAMEMGKVVLQKTTYRLTVKTSEIGGAGTDANVFMIIFGALGDSNELRLKKSENNKNPFQKGQTDVFTFNEMLSLGELSKVRVWHDNKGFGSSWHLNSITIEDLGSKKNYNFPCDKWLSKSEDDKQIIRELTCLQSISGSQAFRGKDKIVYDIEITTTDKYEGGTIHNGWIILEGARKTSKTFTLINSPQNKILRKGTTNNFSFSSIALGKLEHCILGAFEREDQPLDDPRGREAMWHCHEVVVTDTSTGDRYFFPCRKWIDILPRVITKKGVPLEVSKMEESAVKQTRNLAPVKYEVIVITGNEKGAGTNANVFITVFGTNGNTGRRPLTKSFKDLFEKNQTDKFQIEALDLGELQKIRIEHDNSGIRPSWYLERVEIVNLGANTTSVFPCQKWLSKDKGDGETVREIYVKSD